MAAQLRQRWFFPRRFRRKRCGIDHFRLRPIRQFLGRNKCARRLGHRRALFLQLLLDHALLFRQFAPADFQLAFQIRFAQTPLQFPFAPCADATAHTGDSLPNEMNRAQAGHEDETAHINAEEKNDRADTAHPAEEKFLAERIAEPAAGSLNVESSAPTLEMLRLQLEQTRARDDEEHDPAEARHYAQIRMEQFCAAESEQDHR